VGKSEVTKPLRLREPLALSSSREPKLMEPVALTVPTRMHMGTGPAEMLLAVALTSSREGALMVTLG
jgi:hypothetical protein